MAIATACVRSFAPSFATAYNDFAIRSGSQSQAHGMKGPAENSRDTAVVSAIADGDGMDLRLEKLEPTGSDKGKAST